MIVGELLANRLLAGGFITPQQSDDLKHAANGVVLVYIASNIFKELISKHRTEILQAERRGYEKGRAETLQTVNVTVQATSLFNNEQRHLTNLGHTPN